MNVTLSRRICEKSASNLKIIAFFQWRCVRGGNITTMIIILIYTSGNGRLMD